MSNSLPREFLDVFFSAAPGGRLVNREEEEKEDSINDNLLLLFV